MSLSELAAGDRVLILDGTDVPFEGTVLRVGKQWLVARNKAGRPGKIVKTDEGPVTEGRYRVATGEGENAGERAITPAQWTAERILATEAEDREWLAKTGVTAEGLSIEQVRRIREALESDE